MHFDDVFMVNCLEKLIFFISYLYQFFILSANYFHCILFWVLFLFWDPILKIIILIWVILHFIRIILVIFCVFGKIIKCFDLILLVLNLTWNIMLHRRRHCLKFSIRLLLHNHILIWIAWRRRKRFWDATRAVRKLIFINLFLYILDLHLMQFYKLKCSAWCLLLGLFRFTIILQLFCKLKHIIYPIEYI